MALSLLFSRSFSLSLSLATNRPHGYCFIAYSILRRGCVGTSRTQLCIRNALTRPCRHFHPIVCEMLVFLSLFLNEEDEDETVKCARKWRIGSKANESRYFETLFFALSVPVFFPLSLSFTLTVFFTLLLLLHFSPPILPSRSRWSRWPLRPSVCPLSLSLKALYTHCTVYIMRCVHGTLKKAAGAIRWQLFHI